MLEPQVFEPVYLQIAEARPTEYGKRWLDRLATQVANHIAVMRDVARLAAAELWEWPRVLRTLAAEGVPTAISSGVSKTQMVSLINASTKNAAYTAPAAFVVCLCTAAPTSSSTGAAQSETAYVGYARTAATMGASSAADPSVATNTATVTFPNCTGTGSTLLGFTCADNATIGSGNVLWYGTLTSTAISTTQTPPTIAAGALSVQMTGT